MFKHVCFSEGVYIMKIIQSSQNAIYKEWRKLDQKKGRDRSRQFLIEGPHLVEEALKTNQIVAIILDEDTPIPYEETKEVPPLFRLTHELFLSLAQTETPQGIMAVIQMGKTLTNWSGGRFLLIDAVQDPGNLGTMIRTADAAGFDHVILGKGTVDAYNSKTLRSGQGSHFHVNMFPADLEESILQLKKNKIPVLGTSLKGQSLNEITPPETANVALLMGNEGSGVAQNLLEMADTLLKIPMYGQAESLNVAVATGILTFWLRGI
jgi:RNA methyltransferase, TrmH family